ncbi:MAG: hypothetical protein KKA81_04375 [Bacteroidetes bacterium]|nr:hypothetical protein [Bacteroidota bacterium]
MKKFIKLFAFLILAGSVVLSSCKKDDDDDTTPVVENPTINFLVEPGFVSGDVTVNVGDAFKVKVYAAQNASTKKNITGINVRRIFNNQTVGDTTLAFNDPEVTLTVNFEAQPVAGIETLEFKAIDKDGKSKMISLKVTTIEISIPVTKYANITLGSFNDQTYGSFFSTSNGQVYFKADATNNQALIDFAFFLGTTNGATIGSPSNVTLQGVFGIEAWTVKNQTGMVKPAPITAAEFDAIGAEYDFPDFQSSIDLVNQLAPNDVIFFMTQGMKLGFIKVNSVNKRGDVINIDVIIED